MSTDLKAEAPRKAADIPDSTFVAAAIRACRQRESSMATRWDVAAILAGHPELVGTSEACQDFPVMPEKLVIAKARKLIRRGLLIGCHCGCRGDWGPTNPSVHQRADELAKSGVEWMTACEQAKREMWARA